MTRMLLKKRLAKVVHAYAGISNVRECFFNCIGERSMTTGNFNDGSDAIWNRLHTIRGEFVRQRLAVHGLPIKRIGSEVSKQLF